MGVRDGVMGPGYGRGKGRRHRLEEVLLLTLPLTLPLTPTPPLAFIASKKFSFLTKPRWEAARAKVASFLCVRLGRGSWGELGVR